MKLRHPQGDEVRLPGSPTFQDLLALLKAVRVVWPKGVVDFALSDMCPTGMPTDVFICRTDVWQRDLVDKGVTDDNRTRFLHVLVGDDGISIVAEGDGKKVATRVLEAVKEKRPRGR